MFNNSFIQSFIPSIIHSFNHSFMLVTYLCFQFGNQLCNNYQMMQDLVTARLNSRPSSSCSDDLQLSGQDRGGMNGTPKKIGEPQNGSMLTNVKQNGLVPHDEQPCGNGMIRGGDRQNNGVGRYDDDDGRTGTIQRGVGMNGTLQRQRGQLNRSLDALDDEDDAHLRDRVPESLLRRPSAGDLPYNRTLSYRRNESTYSGSTSTKMVPQLPITTQITRHLSMQQPNNVAMRTLPRPAKKSPVHSRYGQSPGLNCIKFFSVQIKSRFEVAESALLQYY